MAPFSQPLIQKKNTRWLFLILALSVIDIGITLYGASSGYVLIPAHLFYLPIIFTAYFFPRRGVIASLLCAILFLTIIFLSQPAPGVLSGAVLEAAILVGIGGLLSILSEQVNRQEQRYASIFESSETGIILVDRKTLLIKGVNRYAGTILGMDLDDTAMIRFPDLFTSQEPADQFLMQVSLPEGVSQWEVVFQGPGGRRSDVLLSGHLLDDQTVLATFIDITGNKKMQEALRSSEERYRMLVENAHEGIWAVDGQGVTTYVNPMMGSMMGYAPEEMVGSPIFTFMDGEDRETAREYLIGRVRAVSENFEFRFIRKNGECVTTLLSASPLVNKTGEYAGALALVTDITPRKRAETALRLTRERFHQVFISSPAGIAIIDHGGRIIDTNPAFREIFGFTREESGAGFSLFREPFLAESLITRISGGETLSWKSHFDCENVKKTWEERPVTKKSGTISIHGIISPLRALERTGIEGYVAIIQDITRDEQILRELDDSNRRYQVLFNESADAILVHDPDGTVRQANAAAGDLFASKPENLAGTVIPQLFHEQGTSDDPGKRKHFFYETSVLKSGTTAVPVEIHTRPLELSGVSCLVSTVRDISSIRDTLEYLKESDERYRSIGELIPYGVWMCDRAGGVTFASSAFLRLLGKNLTSIRGRSWPDIYPSTDRGALTFAWSQFVSKGDSFEYEVRIPDAVSGEPRFILSRGVPVKDTRGQIVSFAGLHIDITDRSRSFDLLVASLREKEILFKEVHHRVKNNMQVISSLLSLQSGQLHDKESVAAFRECEQRVRSMALVHEKLYQSRTFGLIHAREYFTTLVDGLIVPGNRSLSIRTAYHFDDIQLPLDLAIPCGLIVNELIVNILKHAFPEGQGGTISVSLQKSAGGMVDLTISDDGVGVPPGFDVGEAQTLGLQLVRVLTGQINGTLTMAVEQGTTFCIRFPERI